jgi:hypothetical protein
LNVEPASSEENVNVADVLVVGEAGPESIVVSGGVVSLGGAAPCAGTTTSIANANVHNASAGNAPRVCRRREAFTPTGMGGGRLKRDLLR